MDKNTGRQCLYIFSHAHHDYLMVIKTSDAVNIGLIKNITPIRAGDRRKMWLITQLAVHQFLMSIKKDKR